MASDYGDFCREQRDRLRKLRAKLGVPCPECVQKLPKAYPTILLPGQRCKIHNYKDARKRDANYD
jgi:hypothetical protein